DIICASETWLNSSIPDGEVIDNIYSLFRKDRDKNTSERKRGGGVLIAVKKNITAELIETDSDHIEQIFVKVKCKEGDVIIGCVYLPPLSPLDIYNSHTNTISYLHEKYNKCKLIIIGDYNFNLFASFFKSIYNVNAYDSSTPLHVTYDDVYKQLRKLNDRKEAGPDGVPNILLKRCAAGLAEPITHLFDISLRSGVFPAAWKISFISPIHKAGPRCDVTNYRPVCIQSAIAKLFEKIVLPQINIAFYNTISTKQHGFVSGHSTATNLYLYTGHVLDAMNEGLTTHTIYTDFSKAFDMVDHQVLIKKLDRYNIKNKALEWLKSYLSDRHLQVRVNGHISESYKVISGVPQGSHLGPTLFNIFVNDIGEQFKSEYLLYADDLKIFRKINSEEDINILQHLSIIVDSKLNFVKHVDKITSQVYKILGFIIRSGKEFKDPNTLIHLFKTLVHPILEYCSIISSPHTQGLVDEVEKIQRKFCKFVS
ncbi:GSCOCG00012025001-RA-CDS, partial [Cotesia congregata]